MTPTISTLIPEAHKPAAKAASIMVPEMRVSLPTKKRCTPAIPLKYDPAALPN